MFPSIQYPISMDYYGPEDFTVLRVHRGVFFTPVDHHVRSFGFSSTMHTPNTFSRHSSGEVKQGLDTRKIKAKTTSEREIERNSILSRKKSFYSENYICVLLVGHVDQGYLVIGTTEESSVILK